MTGKDENVPSPRRRRLHAFLVATALSVALFFFSPGLPRLFAEVFSELRQRGALRHLLAAGEGETRMTNRVCRFRGTEWDTQIQTLKATPEQIIDALDAVYARPNAPAPGGQPAQGALEHLAAAALATAQSKTAAQAAAQRTGQTAARPTPGSSTRANLFHFYSVDRNSITRVYGEMSPLQEKSLMIAIASSLDGEQSVLVTMKIRRPESIRNLACPPDAAALRREVEEFIPLFPLAAVTDKVENETADAVYTTYVIEQQGHIEEISDFYASAAPDVETFVPTPGDPDLFVAAPAAFQSVQRADTRIDIIHLCEGRADQTTTLVKIRRFKPTSTPLKGS